MAKKIIYFIATYFTVLAFIMGCVYTEGDDKALESFELMTTQEKAMHDKAVDGHYESYLVSIRDAVRKRIVVPNERAVPFIDIANVIKYCDENILIPKDSWGESTRKKARASKFSLQDPTWYKKILIAAEQEIEYDTQLKIKEAEESKIRNDIKQRINNVSESVERLKVESNSSDLLPLKNYRDVKTMARGCDGAINIIELAASKDKPLTNKDADDILYQKSICETKKLNDNM